MVRVSHVCIFIGLRKWRYINGLWSAINFRLAAVVGQFLVSTKMLNVFRVVSQLENLINRIDKSFHRLILWFSWTLPFCRPTCSTVLRTPTGRVGLVGILYGLTVNPNPKHSCCSCDWYCWQKNELTRTSNTRSWLHSAHCFQMSCQFEFSHKIALHRPTNFKHHQL